MTISKSDTKHLESNTTLYLEGKVPKDYVCCDCGAKGVKLWHDCYTHDKHQPLRCLPCTCSEQGKVRTPTEDGCSLYEEKRHMYRTAGMESNRWKQYNPDEGLPSDAVETKVWRNETDQIGWFVPAVPTEKNDAYWAYTAVPAEACEWWYNLPFSNTR